MTESLGAMARAGEHDIKDTRFLRRVAPGSDETGEQNRFEFEALRGVRR